MMKKRMFCIVMIIVLNAFITAIAPAVSAATISSYYDVDFDQAGDTNTAWTNKTGSGKTFATTYNNAGVSVLRMKDDIRGSQALKISLPRNADTSKLFRMGMESVGISGLDGCVTWYEASFKFEQANSGGSLVMASCPFSFNESGEFYIGGIKGNAAFPGEKVTNFTLGLNEWYHLVVAADYKDKINGSPKLYAWINGEFLTTASAGSAGYTRNWTYAAKTTSAVALRFALNPNSTADSVFWLDNFKVYTTDTQVKDANGVLCLDPTDIFDGAEITSDCLKIENDMIYVPASETLGGVSVLINTGHNGAGYFDGTAAVGEDDLVVTSAVGKTVYARSTSGIGIKKYTIAEGARLYDNVPSTAVWKKKAAETGNDNDDGYTTVTNISGIAAGDSVKLTLDFINDTSETKNSVLVLAAYNGTALSDYCFTDISVPVGGTEITSKALNIKDTTNLTIKAHVWKSVQDYTSEMTRFEMEQ